MYKNKYRNNKNNLFLPARQPVPALMWGEALTYGAPFVEGTHCDFITEFPSYLICENHYSLYFFVVIIIY